jgi:Holliday junction resolvase RusA-like endonuclease
MGENIQFEVLGEPVPQGSTRSFHIKKLNRVVTTHSNRNTDRWRERIATEAQKAQESNAFYSDDRKMAYFIILDFYFSKPKSTPKKILFNTKRPDLDKLIRAVLDGITDVLIPDDAQVMGIMARKYYAEKDTPPHLGVRLFKAVNDRSVPNDLIEVPTTDQSL